MSQSQEFSQFTIAHQLKRRIRIIAPSLYRDKERAYILQILLLKREAIEDVKVVSEINSVTIQFDSERFPKQNLLNLLEIVLTNFKQKPRDVIGNIIDPVKPSMGEKQNIVFGIGGMSCASCALFLEMVLSREPANYHVSINYISQTGAVNGFLKKSEIFKIIENNGYQAYSIDSLAERKILLDSSINHLVTAKKQLILIGLLSVPVFLITFFSRKNKWMRLLQATLSVSVIVSGGRDIFKKSFIQAREGILNMDTLIAIGAGSAFLTSIPSIFDQRRHAYFEASTAIIGFVQLGRFLELLAKSKMVREIEALVNMQPQNVTLLEDGNEKIVLPEHIKCDDIVLIRPGERVPVDGTVVTGLSTVDESIITGSSAPSIKEQGHSLFEGSINGSGVLNVKATAIGKDTMLASLMHMIDQAQNSKLQIQKTADNISSRLMPAILLLSAATFVGWLLKGERVAHAFANALSVILISCPCALGLATPAATSVSSGKVANRKVYIRNGKALEVMATIDTIIFDKTGTLTTGKAKVDRFLNVSELADNYLLQLAASVEFNSEHLYAKAIVEYTRSKKLTMFESAKFHSIPDQGVRSEVDGHEVLLGNESWLSDQSVDLSLSQHVKKEEGGSQIYLVVDKKLSGIFTITDRIRIGVDKLIKFFHDQNIETLMVTGDTAESARPIAKLAGIDSILVQASPIKKIQFIRDLQSKGRVVAMVGDGINDAPALSAADVSLVVGRATGIAIAASDYVLVDGDITKVAEVLEVSKQTLTVVKQNLVWAFAYNLIAVPVAMTGKLNPMVSSATMALSSISVIANSLRLRKN